MLALNRRTFLTSALTGVGAALLPRSAMALQVVDLQLILAIDCSYSVDQREYNLQVGAIGDALGQPEIRQAIGEGPSGSIALSLVAFWSGPLSLPSPDMDPWSGVTGSSIAWLAARSFRSETDAPSLGGNCT